MLGRQVAAVLGQHAPAGVDVDRVSADLCGLEGVIEIHDLHLWTLTSGMHVATAHLVTGDETTVQQVLDRARDVLLHEHGIAHATLQVEPHARTSCSEIDW
jgi:cobalt-zinc-cadmium efflux system protein